MKISIGIVCLLGIFGVTKSYSMNIIGQKFNKLTVIEEHPERKHRLICYVCLCDCGRTSIVRGTELIKGRTKACSSCGHTKHGKARTREYHIWTNIKYRCNNPKSGGYQKYGAKGIKICDRWSDSFENFITDMGLAPSLRHSIERINNRGNYDPLNCKWALPIEQMNNRTVNKFLTYNGETKTLSQWATQIKVNPATLGRRILNGWDIEKALLTPVIDSKFKKGHNRHTKT